MVCLVDISNLKSQISKLHLKSANFHQLISIQNQWMGKYEVPISVAQRKRNASIEPLVQPWQSIRCTIEILLLPIGDALEILFKKLELWKIDRHPLTQLNLDKIIVSDKELMFHPSKHPNAHE
jgi:hypothetical protein